MVEKETTIAAAEGLHARPAAEFVHKAKGFSSDIVVVKDGREANAKSPLKLMTLAAKHGEKITIRADGDDAEEAVNTLVELISTEERWQITSGSTVSQPPKGSPSGPP
jgi:phosphocarrier protein HPr